ncbi:hypothetical protein [Mycoplasma sp. VS30B]
MKIVSKTEDNFIWINFKKFDIANFYDAVISKEIVTNEKDSNIDIQKYFHKLCTKYDIKLNKVNYSFKHMFISFEISSNEDITKLITVLIKQDNAFASSSIFVNIGRVLTRELRYN